MRPKYNLQTQNKSFFLTSLFSLYISIIILLKKIALVSKIIEQIIHSSQSSFIDF